jgi:hypothetical protein
MEETERDAKGRLKRPPVKQDRNSGYRGTAQDDPRGGVSRETPSRAVIIDWAFLEALVVLCHPAAGKWTLEGKGSFFIHEKFL